MSTFGRLLWSVIRAPIKGTLGESGVKAGAALTLPSSIYRRYHDITLTTATGNTTQIDHVFVSKFGVFVVETKNKSGWIFGSEKDREWTQTFPNGQKFKFQNPLWQNHGHVKAIERVLDGMDLPGGIVQSVVVFVGDAEFKSEIPEKVTVGFGAADYIRSFKTEVLTGLQVLKVCAAIESARMEQSWATNQQHVRNLKKRKTSTQRQCPRCRKQMVLRTTRKGPNEGRQFWGCKGFPKCRATEKA